MVNDARNVEFIDTRFVFRTNFQGDPARDTFRSNERKANIIINDEALAQSLMAEGFKVKQTNPQDERYQPEYYIPVKVKFKDDLPEDDGRQPKICLVQNGVPVRLYPDNIHLLDMAADNREIGNVKVMCSKYHNEDRGTNSLYVRVMYVEKSNTYDPYASLYTVQQGEELDF